MKRSTAEISSLIVAAIMAGPKSKKEILLTVGINPNHNDLVSKYVNALHNFGCIYIHSYRLRSYPVWAWNPTLFANPDAEMVSVLEHKRQKMREHRESLNFKADRRLPDRVRVKLSAPSIFSAGQA